jgi:hypothetical protein
LYRIHPLPELACGGETAKVKKKKKSKKKALGSCALMVQQPSAAGAFN